MEETKNTVQHLYAFFKTHVVETIGTITGSGTGLAGIKSGAFNVSGDLHTIALALLTGAAGGLGALLTKLIWHKIVKYKQAKNNG